MILIYLKLISRFSVWRFFQKSPCQSNQMFSRIKDENKIWNTTWLFKSRSCRPSGIEFSYRALWETRIFYCPTFARRRFLIRWLADQSVNLSWSQDAYSPGSEKRGPRSLCQPVFLLHHSTESQICSGTVEVKGLNIPNNSQTGST